MLRGWVHLSLWHQPVSMQALNASFQCTPPIDTPATAPTACRQGKLERKQQRRQQRRAAAAAEGWEPEPPTPPPPSMLAGRAAAAL